jgi:hypothetical protein
VTNIVAPQFGPVFALLIVKSLFVNLSILFTAAGCAHTAINAETQDAYFTCPNVQVGDAEANLAADGWPIENASANSVTTAYRPIAIPGEAQLSVLTPDRRGVSRVQVGSERYRVRITVGKAGAAGVRFHVFQSIDYASFGPAKNTREIDWDTIYSEQIDHEPTRLELNRYRKAVCGGAPFFGH